MQLSVACWGEMLQLEVAAWTSGQKDKTTLWWNRNFFKKRTIEAKARKETTRTIDLMEGGLWTVAEVACWSSLVWSPTPTPPFWSFLGGSAPVMTLEPGCSPFFWISPVNLLFSVSTLVVMGVSLTSSCLEAWPPPPPSCLAAGKTDWFLTGKDWNGHNFPNTSLHKWTPSLPPTCVWFLWMAPVVLDTVTGVWTLMRSRL